jgi:hypothetical protein
VRSGQRAFLRLSPSLGKQHRQERYEEEDEDGYKDETLNCRDCNQVRGLPRVLASSSSSSSSSSS